MSSRKSRRRDAADALFSRLVRSEVGRCEICGEERGQLQLMHIVSRAHMRLRWDRRNAVCGCVSCHQSMTDDPTAWEAWVREHKGDEVYEELHLEARMLGEKAGDLWVDAELDRLRTQAKAVGIS